MGGDKECVQTLVGSVLKTDPEDRVGQAGLAQLRNKGEDGGHGRAIGTEEDALRVFQGPQDAAVKEGGSVCPQPRALRFSILCGSQLSGGCPSPVVLPHSRKSHLDGGPGLALLILLGAL